MNPNLFDIRLRSLLFLAQRSEGGLHGYARAV